MFSKLISGLLGQKPIQSEENTKAQDRDLHHNDIPLDKEQIKCQEDVRIPLSKLKIIKEKTSKKQLKGMSMSPKISLGKLTTSINAHNSNQPKSSKQPSKAANSTSTSKVTKNRQPSNTTYQTSFHAFQNSTALPQQKRITSTNKEVTQNGTHNTFEKCVSPRTSTMKLQPLIKFDFATYIKPETTQTLQELTLVTDTRVITEEEQPKFQVIKPNFVGESKIKDEKQRVSQNPSSSNKVTNSTKKTLMSQQNKSIGMNLKQTKVGIKYSSPQFNTHTNKSNFTEMLNQGNQTIQHSNHQKRISLSMQKAMEKVGFSNTMPEHNSQKATAATCTPMKNDQNRNSFNQTIKEVSFALEESPDQQFITTANLKTKKLTTPVKNQSETHLIRSSELLKNKESHNKLVHMNSFAEQNQELLIQTLDQNEDDASSFYPSQKSTFSYEPKFYKPSKSSIKIYKPQSVNSNNSPLNLTNSTFQIDQVSNNFNFMIPGSINTTFQHQQKASFGQPTLIQSNSCKPERDINLNLKSNDTKQRQQQFIITPRQLQLKAAGINEHKINVNKGQIKKNAMEKRKEEIKFIMRDEQRKSNSTRMSSQSHFNSQLKA